MTMHSKSPVGNFFNAITGWRGLLLVLGLALAWHALQGQAWAEAWKYLSGIGPFALLSLLALNLLMLPLMTARGWQLLWALGLPVKLSSLCAYRLSANAVSYLTPGPHFGGEPLFVYLLHQQQQIPLAVATTSVALDRLLELLASIVVLICSLVMLIATGSVPFAGSGTLLLAFIMLGVLIALLRALFTGKRPLSGIISWFMRVSSKYHVLSSDTALRLLRAIIQGETMAESLWHEHRRSFLLANLCSLGHWLGMLAEFWLMSFFLGEALSWSQLLALVITARLTFLTPLPAGLGVLESALPWVTGSLGLGSGLGLSLCLLIRFRDILFSLAGLGLIMKYLTCPGKASTVT